MRYDLAQEMVYMRDDSTLLLIIIMWCMLLALASTVIYVTCLDFASNFTQNPSLQVELPYGLIQGKLKRTIGTGRPYYSYEGIPYAKPPVGQLRFRPPQPPDKWSGILEAYGNVPSCIQIPASDKNWYESEDCLYINVYTTKSPLESSPELLPVMVWIYGGGFLFGVANSTYYGPDHLLDENVVVVHFNYRLNVFGFLSTEDLASPGNYGLKDQLAALRWINNCIQRFGGDPQKITVFGESAGGASVQFHILSPKSQGLFHRAISQSGSVLCPWALQTKPLRIANLIGRATGFSGGSTEDLLAYLRRLSTSKLKRAAVSITIMNSIKVRDLPFSPSIEPQHEDAFISDRTYDLLKNGQFSRVPYIIGFNSQESAAGQIYLQLGEPLLRIFSGDEILIPPGLVVKANYARKVWEQIKNFYFTDSKSTVQQYLDFISDSYFYRPITESARLYSIYAPIYMYRFSYEGYFLGKKAFAMAEETRVNGVMHAEEVWYLFSRQDLARANDMDKLMRSRMVRFWTNFARTGNPTPEPETLFDNLTWPQFETDTNYLIIDNELEVKDHFKQRTLQFWRDLFEKYGEAPFDTY